MQTSLRRHAAILSFVASLTLVSASAASLDANLPNFQMVDEHIYRGGQPTPDGFKLLAERGIKTVIDLRDMGEHSQADEQKYVSQAGMRYISIPMHGLSTPNSEKVAQVEAIFNDPSNGPVFVHCKRGADRTGMVVAVYRISHDGWKNGLALSEAKSYGMSPFERAIQHYVKDYRPTVTLAAAGAANTPASDGMTAAPNATPHGESNTVR